MQENNHHASERHIAWHQRAMPNGGFPSAFNFLWEDCAVIVEVKGDRLTLQPGSDPDFRLFPGRPFLVKMNQEDYTKVKESTVPYGSPYTRWNRVGGETSKFATVLDHIGDVITCSCDFERKFLGLTKSGYHPDAYMGVKAGDIIVVSPYWLHAEYVARGAK